MYGGLTVCSLVFMTSRECTSIEYYTCVSDCKYPCVK